MTRITAIIVAVVLVAGITLASGYMQGRMTERWGGGDDLAELAEKLNQVPERFGDWRLTKVEELRENAAQQLEAAGSFVRVYLNERTGQQVRVAMIVGPTGAMSVHIPEICYEGRDYVPREDRARIGVSGTGLSDAQLWSVVLDSQGLDAQSLHVCYGWSDGRRWMAPARPRFSLSGNPYLYKLQIASEGTMAASGDDTKACVAFLEKFLPELQPYLVAPSTD